MISINTRIISILALICIGSFFLFGVLAMQQYPGGTYSQPTAPGFQWLDNYWCDLYALKTFSGETNAARPWAILATGFLAVGFILSWICIPSLFSISRRQMVFIALPGIAGMALTVFLFSPWHDQIIPVSGALLGLSLLATCPPLYRRGYNKYSFWGWLSLLTGIITFVVYQTGQMLESLPILQKLSMFIFTSWIVGMDLEVLRMTGIEKKLRGLQD